MIFAGHRWCWDRCHRGESLFVSVYSLAAFVVVGMAVCHDDFSHAAATVTGRCHRHRLAFCECVTIWLQSGCRFRRYVACPTLKHMHQNAMHLTEMKSQRFQVAANAICCDAMCILFAHHDHQRERETPWEPASVRCGMCLLVKLRASTSVRNETKWNQPTILINLFAIV